MKLIVSSDRLVTRGEYVVCHADNTKHSLRKKGYFNKGAPVQAHSKLKVRFFCKKVFNLLMKIT